MKPIRSIFAATILSIAIAGCNSSDNTTTALLEVDDNGYSSINDSELASQLDALPLGTISPEEEAGLYYMREEEKLAHDVYTVLYEQWNQRIFSNIADSESTHTEAVHDLIERYNLDDPVDDNGIGVFTDPVLQGLNDSLVATGNASLIDALQVGAAIEELDIIDIETRKLDVVDNDDIILVYDNLIKGSRNHLRAFVSNLENQGISYSPQYLDQNIYDAIISGATEQ